MGGLCARIAAEDGIELLLLAFGTLQAGFVCAFGTLDTDRVIHVLLDLARTLDLVRGFGRMGRFHRDICSGDTQNSDDKTLEHDISLWFNDSRNYKPLRKGT